MHTPMDAETRNLIGATLERFVADVYQPPARLARLKAGAAPRGGACLF